MTKDFLKELSELSKKHGVYVPNQTQMQFSDGGEAGKIQWHFVDGEYKNTSFCAHDYEESLTCFRCKNCAHEKEKD